MAKKPNILVVGSFVMDLIASTDHVPASGETVVGLSFHSAPGGKGANQAAQCARLGANVTMMGCVGKDIFGQEMLRCTADSGVQVSRVKIADNVSSGIGHVLLEVSGNQAQNRITVIPGANLALEVSDVAWLEQEIHRYDMVLLQLEVPMEVNLAVARWADAANVPVLLNPAPAQALPEELLPYVSCFAPNEHEAAAMTGFPLKRNGDGIDQDSVDRMLHFLEERGLKQILVTLGRFGAVWKDASGFLHIPPAALDMVVDPTGAGDSFVAAFATVQAAGLPCPQALTFATYAAAITISRMGAMPALPTLEEVNTLLLRQGHSEIDVQLLRNVLG